ncbi:hypothetical protein D3C86_2103320 [compost metagenome]
MPIDNREELLEAFPCHKKYWRCLNLNRALAVDQRGALGKRLGSQPFAEEEALAQVKATEVFCSS